MVNHVEINNKRYPIFNEGEEIEIDFMGIKYTANFMKWLPKKDGVGAYIVLSDLKINGHFVPTTDGLGTKNRLVNLNDSYIKRINGMTL